MSSIADLVEQMAAAGAPVQAIVMAVRAIEAASATNAERKAKNAERQRRHRVRNATVTSPLRDGDATVTQPPPQTPLRTITPPSPPLGGSGTPRKTAPVGSRLAADFELPDDWRQWAINAGLDPPAVDAEADKFRDFWLGKAGKDGRKADWPATWRNWIRRKLEDRNGQRSQHAKQNSGTARFDAWAEAAVDLERRRASAL